MKGSLIILAFFTAGLLLGLFGLLPAFIAEHDFTMLILYALIFFVGAAVGADRETLEKMKSINLKIILAPLTVIIGTYIGVLAVSVLLTDMYLKDALAIGSGFGYYSLSSVIITEIRGDILGVIALASNITREIFTLLAAPLLARHFGKLAPVVSGGATAMDTTLPIITRYSGGEYALVAVFSGVALTSAVPVLVTFFVNL